MSQSRLRSSTTEDIIESYGTKNSRGKYRCGLCGQLKVCPFPKSPQSSPQANHHCPYMIEVPTRSIATQADPPVADANIPTSHPFYSGPSLISPLLCLTDTLLLPLLSENYHSWRWKTNKSIPCRCFVFIFSRWSIIVASPSPSDTPTLFVSIMWVTFRS
jgi:hypothetical protein